MELDDAVGQEVVNSCKDMSGWVKFLGIVLIVAGAIYALSLVGIIIAWLPIWIGVILLRVANNCREVSGGTFDSLGDILGSLKTYFLLMGILAIVSIILSIIWFMVFIFGAFSGILNGAGGFY